MSGLQVGATRQRFLRGLLLGGTALDGIGALDMSSVEAANADECRIMEDEIELF
jgi:hypothetical protein